MARGALSSQGWDGVEPPPLPGAPRTGVYERDALHRPTRRIVITGGPAAGKSHVIQDLEPLLHGRADLIAETATLLYENGLPRAESDDQAILVQRAIFAVQRGLEEVRAALRPHPFQICDRGCLDGAAYWPAGLPDFLARIGTTHEQELHRYHAVVFLQSSACLPGTYRNEGNTIRTEGAAEAQAIDERLRVIWSPHPRFHLVPCRASLAEKRTEALLVLKGLLQL